MLFIFRKLRRSFFLPGKVRTYAAYAFGEIVLIVLGIMIALQIGEWNQARSDHREETQLLLRLKAEFEENQIDLKKVEADNQEISSNMMAFLDIIEPEPDSYPDELIQRYMHNLSWSPDYTPNTAMLDSLIASGKISLIANEILNYKLNTWPADLEEPKAFSSYMDSNLEINWDTYSDYYRFKTNRIAILEDSGPSHFPNDQKALLAQPKLEDMVERHRVLSEEKLLRNRRLLNLQQEILDLIDVELHASQ